MPMGVGAWQVQGLTLFFEPWIAWIDVVNMLTGFRRGLSVECDGDLELAHWLEGLGQEAFQVANAAARGRSFRPYDRRRRIR